MTPQEFKLLERLTVALEAIAHSLQCSNPDLDRTDTIFDLLNSITATLEEMNTKGIETYEQNRSS